MGTPKDPFGLLAFLHWNHEWNNWHFNAEILPKAVAQIENLGMRMVRLDILWSDLHQQGKPLNFERYDKLVALLDIHHIEVLGVLQYNKIDRDKNGKEIWNVPPPSFADFADYVRQTIRHYKGRIRYYEIWNEPNHAVYWSEPPDQLKKYCELLEISYQAAKQADPQCLVLNGGLTEPIFNDVKHLYANGGKNFTDVMNIHTFLDPLAPNVINHFSGILKGVKKIMDENGDGSKKIWITEMGCPGVPEKEAPKKWFAGDNVTEAQQADWLESIYKAIEKEDRVEKLFWAFYRDTNNEFKDATDNFGLVKMDLTTKPAFHRLKKEIREYRR